MYRELFLWYVSNSYYTKIKNGCPCLYKILRLIFSQLIIALVSKFSLFFQSYFLKNSQKNRKFTQVFRSVHFQKGVILENYRLNLHSHCVKGVCIWSYSGPHFPKFGLNTLPYSVRMHKNADQYNSRNGHFLRSVRL